MSYVPFSAINPTAASQYVTNKPGSPWLRDYAHASKLYRSNNYALSPKAGFLYFVDFNVSPKVKELLGGSKDQTNIEMLALSGLLARSVQLPKFKVATETINQYNRKTNVQTKLTYEPVRLEFHDDNASNTNSLWQNYYKYYYKDSAYAPNKVGSGTVDPAFKDTKFGEKDYAYGYQNFKQEPFFTSIDIYVLHQGNFTSMSLINPLITGWDHDTLDQTESTKILKNSMTIVYEDVFYDKGFTLTGDSSAEFIDSRHYDTTSSPLNYPTAETSNVGTDNKLYRPDQYNNVKPPATGQLSAALLGLSSTLRAINIARELMNNRKRAWAVYGFNIKNVVTNKLADSVFAAAASVTTQSIPPPPTTTVGPNAASNYTTT